MLYFHLHCYSKCYFSSSEEYWQKQPPVVFCKKVFLQISQNSQENTSARVSSLRDSIQVFLVNFQEFVRSPFLQNNFGRLLLYLEPCQIIYDRTFLWKYRSSSPGVLFEKVFLETSQNSQENTCASAFFKKKLACNFIKKETLAQVFSCELCKISKSTFS